MSALLSLSRSILALMLLFEHMKTWAAYPSS